MSLLATPLAKAAPVINFFTADQFSVAPGTNVNLSWSVDNFDDLLLNGVDVTGLNSTIVVPLITTTYTLTATNPNGATSEEVRVQVVLPGEPIISEFMADNESGLLDEDGEPSDWIEICNATTTPASLNGYYLTDDANNLTKWQFPDTTLGPRRYLVVFATGNDRAVAGSELHTNFSLDLAGEYLALVKPDGTTIVNEFAPFPNQRADISYGFNAQTLQAGYFVTATPGATNVGGFTDFVADTTFSVDRGFFDTTFEVAITTATPDAEIRYTLDGTKPTANTGRVYGSPFRIGRTTILRAAAFKDGLVPTNVDTQTYIRPSQVIAQSNMRTSVTQDPVYGPQMDAALKAVPTISLVFQGDVERSEKEASVEFINFEAGSIQLDAGMERFGNYVTNFSKRSIRLNFRSEYGPTKLRFPVFDGHEYPIPPADRFDSIDLRSGNHDMQSRGAYMSNRFTDDTMLDMGNIAPHGRFVHVYLNGQYWGQYHLRERWNGAMLSEYFGGSKDDYEAVNANNSGNEFQTGIPYDGTGQYWNETRSLVAGPDPFSSSVSHIDVPDVTDFMLLWVSGNSESEFRSAGSVPLGVPFKFFMKDADGFLRPPGHSVTHNGPLNVMTEMRTEGDPDYKMLVADRIHKHYFHDGAFTPAKNIARLQSRVDEIEVSFLAESARWGEQTPASWLSFQNNLIAGQFPSLTNTMISRFRGAGMYPNLDAPAFHQHGGNLAPGTPLRITAPQGTIYYTVDGTDPRVWAVQLGSDGSTALVPESAAKKVYVPANATDGFTDGAAKNWKEVSYNDGGWRAGTGGVGFDSGAGNRFGEYYDIDMESEMDDQRTSCLIRIPFTPDPGALNGKTVAVLRVRYDDAYVAYLNGTEIWRENFSGGPDGDSAAEVSHPDSAAISLQPVDIVAHLGLINEGQENVLAIHAMNLTASSSDFLLSAEIRVSNTAIGAGAGGPAGTISDTAIPYTGSIPIDTLTRVRARALQSGNWSALNEAIFVPQQDLDRLVVSEFNYNPAPATPTEIAAGFNDSEDFEYLELLNTGSETLALNGIRFVDGIAFDFTGSSITSLPAGERLVIVEDRDAFEFRYGPGLPIAGQYTGKLKDEGETLTYADGLGVAIRSFTYNNVFPWPLAAAGLGSSLVLIDPDSRPNHDLFSSWQASALPGGTPGTGETPLLTYAAWAAANGVVDPEGDDDFDGLNNFLEFILLGDPLTPSGQGSLGVEVQSLDVGGGPEAYLVMVITHRLTGNEIEMTAELSGDLVTWDPEATVLHDRVNHGDGTVTSTYRSAAPISAALHGHIRVRFSAGS